MITLYADDEEVPITAYLAVVIGEAARHVLAFTSHKRGIT
ncbi:hypothetical protein SEA_AVATARAHPEG_62 [Mycobacterium phage AvatarAhPeg]|uniref:Uncharacterized protein n=1 Tax=Mycobacterium phage Stink TaxID=3136630 RepID=A0AAU8GMM2_9VIRU|nr:hypothetical protein SEA_AVATARAHPEG_62 [Mycobacterium phage AvatarAhPeg]